MANDQIRPAVLIINNGKGITHALKNLVNQKHMKLSDGSISKAEWKATEKALEEIQEERKKKGQPSIFDGNVNTVKDGTKIKFTKEEMEKLYKAMGVEFSDKASSAGAAKKKEGATSTKGPKLTGPRRLPEEKRTVTVNLMPGQAVDKNGKKIAMPSFEQKLDAAVKGVLSKQEMEQYQKLHGAEAKESFLRQHGVDVQRVF